MNKLLKNKALSNASITIFSISIVCSAALFFYAGALSGWNLGFFLVLASKTLFLGGVIFPILGIFIARHIARAPTRVEEVLEGIVLLVCWLSSLYVIFIAFSLIRIIL